MDFSSIPLKSKTLWMVVALNCVVDIGVGVLIGNYYQKSKTQEAQTCFDACAGLVLLTPDEPGAFIEAMEKVARCAEAE